MIKLYRVLFFLISLFVPIIFGWWLFLPIVILYIYLAKLPYEIIVVGVVLDTLYYFGDNFLVKHQLTIFAFLAILLALFLSEKIHWRKII